jgi:hypothetical protein
MTYEDERLRDYVDVAARLRELRRRYPAASLGPAEPFRIVEVAGITFLVYVAACWRWPGDSNPGTGSAWEPVPGRTPYTRDSELQNAETSAWGRAIVAALAADTHAGVASRDEVAPRLASAPAPPVRKARTAPAEVTGTTAPRRRDGRQQSQSLVTAEDLEHRLAELPTEQRVVFGDWAEDRNLPPLPSTPAVRSTMARRLAELEADVARNDAQTPARRGAGSPVSARGSDGGEQ